MLKVPDGTLRILVQGGQRVRIDDVGRARQPYLVARVAEAPDVVDEGPELTALMRNVQQTFSTHHRGGPVPARGAADGGRQRRRPVRALAPDRRLAADQDRGEAGAARGASTSPSRLRRLSEILARELEVVAIGSRIQSQVQSEIDKTPARVRAAPAAQGDPGGARRARPGRGRGRASCASSSTRSQLPEEVRKAGRPRALAARAAAAGGRRARRDPQLPRVDRVAAVGHVDRGQPRPRARARGARRRPLRHRARQGPHPRVPRRAAR